MSLPMVDASSCESSKAIELDAKAYAEPVAVDQQLAIGQEKTEQKEKVCIVTYGCAHNQSDSEYMAGQLAANGYELIAAPESADAIIINSCTVKGPSQDGALSLLRKWKGKPIIMAGCVPQAAPHHPAWETVSVLGVQELDQVISVVESSLRGERTRLLGKARLPSLHLPKQRRNPYIEIIPINLGCLGACTYCKTKHARGQLRSYPVAEIVGRARTAIAEGVTQIWLTSEDSGAYGRDIGSSLPDLLEELLTVVPEHVMIRVGMTNPPFILEHLDRIAKLLNAKNIFSFLHIPVQSGSDAVLSAMRREYDVASFERVVSTLRSSVPHLTVATDIICGFPTETDDDFLATMALVTAHSFPILHISQFYPRPGTPAAKLQLLPTQEVKRRSTLLTKLFQSQQPYASLLGTTQDVWLSERNKDGLLLGHTKSYVLTLVDGPDALLGTKQRVRIVRTGKHFLLGELL